MVSKKLKPPFSLALTTEELAAMDDEEIDFSDIPEATEEWFAKARIRYPTSANKKQLTIWVDADIAAFFKAMGIGWEIRMNEVLRTHVQSQASVEN
jgi:uncharacterized protein (DUF4415 family)